MCKMSIVLAVVVVAAVMSAGTLFAADEKTEVMMTVHQFVDSFNKGDSKTAAAACADQTSIIDEFPPHEWHGAGGCSRWMNDFDADSKKNGITDGVVTLKTPRHTDITADHAYIVVPADYTFKKKGKVMKEIDAILTIALQKSPAGWRITGWSWTKNE